MVQGIEQIERKRDSREKNDTVTLAQCDLFACFRFGKQ